MTEVPEEGRGRLGRLFAALVSTDDDVDAGNVEADDGNTSVLDIEALSDSLVSSPDPMAVLASFVVDVRARIEAAALPGGALAPSAVEAHLASRLVEAGLLETDVELPAAHVVRPRTSGLFYLRIDDAQTTQLARLRVLRIESALNDVLLASHVIEDVNDATVEELVRVEQRVARSITSQAAEVAARAGTPARGEWDVRRALSFGIESMRLPHRLTARFRVNVTLGLAAFEVDLVQPSVWSQSAYVDGLGVVPATREMRRRAATDYNARLAVLLSGYALTACPQLREVWVAGVVDGADGHACYYSARLTRDLIEGLDLDDVRDPLAVLRAAGAALDERDRTLAPVTQGFSLDDERLCPARRHDPVELSDRELRDEEATALGCRRADGLATDETAARRSVARELTRELSDSTEENVRAILAAARRSGRQDVLEAATRCVTGLIEGTLPDDPVAIEEALVVGDDLTVACGRARERLGARDIDVAARIAEGALLPVDGLGTYDGLDGTRWLSFASPTERVLYNRLVASPGETPALVPAAYPEAHTIAAVCDLARGRVDDALGHARRASEVAPLSPQATLNLAQCLEAAGDVDGAEQELAHMLALAHDAESVGVGYLQMAQLQWQRGRVLAAQACYQRATRHLGAPALVAGLAVVALIGHVGASAGGELTAEQADSVLLAAGIPLAPTEAVAAALLEGARAATNAELFGVARDLTRSLCTLSRDDVTYGVLRSLEDEPDR